MKDKCILLVEDNPYDEALTIEAFRANHFTNHITVARDGEEALDYILGRKPYSDQNPDEQPMLILLDLKLPKYNGIEILKQLRANPATAMLPVVILTSSKEDEDVVKSYQNGANSYVRKPVDFSEFVEAVKQLGMYWTLLNEPPPSKRKILT